MITQEETSSINDFLSIESVKLLDQSTLTYDVVYMEG